MSRRVSVRPGKGQSIVGFFGGIIFCFIGLFIVIPVFGPFGIIWSLFAVVITVVNGINAFSDKGMAEHEIIVDDGFGNVNIEGGKTAEERLNELQRLFEKGMITSEEYQEKRKKILEEI